jgi:hypothetical protein
MIGRKERKERKENDLWKWQETLGKFLSLRSLCSLRLKSFGISGLNLVGRKPAEAHDVVLSAEDFVSRGLEIEGRGFGFFR